MNKYVLGLLVFLVIFKIVWISNMPMIADEYGHYFLAKYILDKDVPFFYQEPFLQPNWGIVQMPLFHEMLAFFMFFLPMWLIRLLFGIGIPLITTYFLWKLFYKYDKFGIVAVLFNFIPSYFIWSSTIYIDAFYVMLSLITIYYYVNNKNRWTFFFVLDMLSKFFIPLGIIPPLLYDSWKSKKWNKFIMLIILTAILLPIQIFVNNLNTIGIKTNFEDNPQNSVLRFISMMVGIYPNNLFQFDMMYTANFILMTMLPIFLVFMPFILKEHKFECIWFLTYMPFLIFGSTDMRRFLLTSPLIFLSIWLAVKDRKPRNIILIVIFVACLLTIINSYRSMGYMPEFYEAMDFINTLPKDAYIYTPFPYETSYFTGRAAVSVNMNFLINNVTYVFLVRNWLEAGYFYMYTIPNITTIHDTWIPLFENREYEILKRP